MRKPRITPRVSLKGPLLIAALATGGVAGAIVQPETVNDMASAVGDTVSAVGLSPSCAIKGNISMEGGQRIYHVPGQTFYDETRIRPEYGERWFCSEEEARQAGWRKARR